MTVTFSAKDFTLPQEIPEMMPAQFHMKTAMTDFSEEFGIRFKRTPVKGLYFLSSNKRDLVITFSTLMFADTGKWSVAFYRANLADFKKAFAEEKHTDMFIHVEDLDPDVLFPGIRIAEIMKERLDFPV